VKGLLTRIALEVRWPVAWFCLGLCLVMSLLTALLPKVLANMDQLFEKLKMIKPLLTALLGVDPGEQAPAQVAQAFLWVHPTVLTLLWAHETMYCTRCPAGEVDRGTADFLYCLPVSRWRLFVAETVGWLLSGGMILGAGYTGHLVASTILQPEMSTAFPITARVMINLGAVYLAVGGLAFLVSSLSDRRGRAIGIVFGILLASFLLNVLAQFVEWAGMISWLSMLHYYRPAIILQTKSVPWADISILTGMGLVMWVSAGIIHHRRRLCTV
jgi:ABC-2 type transport system permease protein